MNTDNEVEKSEKKQEDTSKPSSTHQINTPNTIPLGSKVFSGITGLELSTVPAKRSPEIKTVNLQEFLASQKNMKFDFSPTRIDLPTQKTISRPKSPSKNKSPLMTKSLPKEKAASSPNGT
ncbi:uncharacterized protein VTP21DRAFT_9025 [Calcarisporiella thermophila]|uniref:uncharacterized protein n=1 Tax=Calcarisporiella thermophila TaxID=911321 RepID=UPI0037433EB7